jgi:hypothetical protein
VRRSEQRLERRLGEGSGTDEENAKGHESGDPMEFRAMPF